MARSEFGDSIKKLQFDAIVRSQNNKLGAFGRINHKDLAPLIGKKVRVTVEELEEKVQSEEA